MRLGLAVSWLVALPMAAGCAATTPPPVDTEAGPGMGLDAARTVTVADASALDDAPEDAFAPPSDAGYCSLYGGCSDANAPDCPSNPYGVPGGPLLPCATDGGVCAYGGRCSPVCSCTHGSWACVVPAC